MFDLYNDVIDLCREVDIVCNYKCNKVLQMINGKGALLALKEIVRSEEDLEGLEMLIAEGREDLAIESLVLSAKYKTEFSDEDREFAKEKINKYKSEV